MRNVAQYIREQVLIRPGDRVVAAVSGGADSVALLRVLLEIRAELGIVLAVAHFNHGLRGNESDADEAFVAELAIEHGLDYFAGQGNVRDHARTSKLSLEAAGRELRYRWFAQLAGEQRLDSIATAHTCDDQAETVLLKFLRGAGTKGLAGIYPVIVAGADNDFRIVRPLLCVTRQDVASYLASLGQLWREDESNRDRHFLRNRVRHELLPQLEREFNPNIRRLLADVAATSRAEEQYWQELVEREVMARTAPDQFSLQNFAQLPVALQRRVLKRFVASEGVSADFSHIEKLRRCALGERTKVELPGGRVVKRQRLSLQWCAVGRAAAPPYWYVLAIPGEIQIAELGLTLRAEIVPEAFAHELPPEELLNPDLVGAELVVRNWRPGDRFWRANSRSEEKLKRLFADQRIAAEERPRWPVATHENEIIWVRGFPVAQSHHWQGKGEALRIEIISRKP